MLTVWYHHRLFLTATLLRRNKIELIKLSNTPVSTTDRANAWVWKLLLLLLNDFKDLLPKSTVVCTREISVGYANAERRLNKQWRASLLSRLKYFSKGDTVKNTIIIITKLYLTRLHQKSFIHCEQPPLIHFTAIVAHEVKLPGLQPIKKKLSNKPSKISWSCI